MKQLTPLSLGADVVSRLLPHRRPFLMVDAVEAYARAPRPALRAARSISANEPIFEGHFPGLALWPGVYTIEGMGQTCNLLRILIELERGFVAAGREADEVTRSLENLELGYRFHPGFRPDSSARLAEVLRSDLGEPMTRIGVSVAVDVKLLHPVFAGERLVYTVTQTHVVDDFIRFDVLAEVGGRAVARGTMSGAMGASLPGVLHGRT